MSYGDQNSFPGKINSSENPVVSTAISAVLLIGTSLSTKELAYSSPPDGVSE